jgi:UDP-glucose 4-epimerase
MEHTMQLYQEMYNSTDFIALRYFNVYGPRQDPKSSYSGVMSKFVQKAIHNDDIEIHGNGSSTRDFVFVGDIARATIRALQRGKGFEVFNVGTGERTSVKELAEKVIEVTSHGSYG